MAIPYKLPYLLQRNLFAILPDYAFLFMYEYMSTLSTQFPSASEFQPLYTSKVQI